MFTFHKWEPMNLSDNKCYAIHLPVMVMLMLNYDAQ